MGPMKRPTGLIEATCKEGTVLFVAVHQFVSAKDARRAFDALKFSETMLVWKEQNFLSSRPERVTLIGTTAREVRAAGRKLARFGGLCLDPWQAEDPVSRMLMEAHLGSAENLLMKTGSLSAEALA